MRVPLEWLAEYVDLTLAPDELAHRLSMAGAEVESIERSGGDWDQVVVGHVLDVAQHPNADRLRVATVEYGADAPLTVVCGAPNVAAGQTVAFATVGAQLRDPRTRELRKLRPGKIRGVESRGMVCSERELGISDEHEGILELQTSAAPGTPLTEVLGATVLEIKPTPNRPDHFSVLGIAREVAALTGGSVREPDAAYDEAGPEIGERTSVVIEDPVGCPRYTAIVVEGVQIGPSPQWLQDAVIAAGMRPINNVVDVTNYVLMEYGQPLHAFDQARLRQRRIVVRRARAGETIDLLDGAVLELELEDLVIADAERAVALAGIMGGADAEVSDSTTTVLLETATFDAATIRRSAARHKIRTEASLRFEKRLNPELALLAARRAAKLIIETAGGTACRGVDDQYPGKQHPPQVVVSVERIKQILAVEPPVERVRGILSALGIPNRWLPPNRYAVSCPPWRSDIQIDDDVVEEIGRIIGYDELPAAALAGSLPEPERDPERALAERLRDVVSGLGFNEVITYAAVAATDQSADALRIENPMSAEQDRLRNSLRPGVLRALARNRSDRRDALQLFQVGKVWRPRAGELPEEPVMLVAVMTGASTPSVHGEVSRPLDFFDAKGVLERIAEGLDLRIDAAAHDGGDDAFAAAETADLSVAGQPVGRLGLVATELVERFDLDARTWLLELALAPLAAAAAESDSQAVGALSAFPPAVEDLALIVDADQPAAELAAAISDQPLVESVELFDIYTGEQVPAGRKSLAWRVVYRAPDRTLSDRDVDRARRGIVRRLERQFKAQLRDN